MSDPLDEAIHRDQREIEDLEHKLRTMPRDLPPEETYSDEVDIPNNVDAVEPKNLNKSIKDKNRS